MTTLRQLEVTYGPGTIVAAKAPEPVKRSTIALTEDQRAKMARRAADRNDRIEASIKDVYEYTEAKAKYLSETCGQKLGKGRKVNAYNAWSHHLAKQKNADADPGEASNLIQLQDEHREEYDNLTPEQKSELCASLEEERNTCNFGIHVNQKGRVQDVKHTLQRIMGILLALRSHCGMEAFVALVRNNTEYDIHPQWFFTSPPINRYLTGAIKRWDIEVIGSQMEVFAIVGCELFTFLRSNRDCADWLKNEIREKMNHLYGEIIGQKGAVVPYSKFEATAVISHGVDCEGWMLEKFGCPSSLPNDISTLRTLRNALDNGDCHFRRLTGAERERRHCDYLEKVSAGMVKAWKPRSDKGKKHEMYHRKGDAYKENEPPSRKRRCVNEEEEEEQDSGSEIES